MQTSFALYHQLEAAGYRFYPRTESALQMLEVYPYAAYAVLLGLLPYPKHTLVGRLQRQLLLYRLGLNIPDPMRIFEEITRHRILQGRLSLGALYAPGALDALAAAYTAWAAANRPKQIALLGDPTEGQIVLPVSGLKAQYSRTAP
jgi:predicted RNase H-like nuclease